MASGYMTLAEYVGALNPEWKGFVDAFVGMAAELDVMPSETIAGRSIRQAVGSGSGAAWRAINAGMAAFDISHVQYTTDTYEISAEHTIDESAIGDFEGGIDAAITRAKSIIAANIGADIGKQIFFGTTSGVTGGATSFQGMSDLVDAAYVVDGGGTTGGNVFIVSEYSPTNVQGVKILFGNGGQIKQDAIYGLWNPLTGTGSLPGWKVYAQAQVGLWCPIPSGNIVQIENVNGITGDALNTLIFNGLKLFNTRFRPTTIYVSPQTYYELVAANKTQIVSGTTAQPYNDVQSILGVKIVQTDSLTSAA